MSTHSGLMATAKLAGALMIASIAGGSAQASTVNFTYDMVGGLTGPPVFTGTSLILDGLATGSVLSGNPVWDAAWNPASLHTHDTLDFATALSNGTFVLTFADGDTITGDFFENDTAVIATNTGPYTEMLTITGGTGMFAGASGSASGGGVVGLTGYTASGKGSVNAAGITPEPSSFAFLFEGLLVMAGGRKMLLRSR